MDQLRKVYGSLTVAQRVGIVAALVAIVAGITGFVRWRHDSDFKPLFTGMAAEDAAAVVQRLKESGVEHRLADNGASVLVLSSRVDDLRLEMAGAGLPRTGRVGFELFDKTNLGITDFTEHINYRRALEGELERSIKSISEIEQARIHISFPKDSVFLDSREPAKASVLLRLRPGARLGDSNVLAITNLVASAVEGLNPDFVSVVDDRGTLLSRPKRSTSETPEASDSALEYKHQVEKDLLAKVQSTLGPLVGEDRFRAGISADCDFTTSEQTEESFDPTRSVMTNSQKSEDVSGTALPSGVPGTPSNLPRTTAAKPADTSRSNLSRRTENVAYQTSRTVRQVKTPRGSIKRISASLLLDQEVRTEGSGAKTKRVLVPPSPEKLKAIRDIVAGVIGLTPERGDQLIVQSLPFEQNRREDLDTAAASKPSPVSARPKWMSNPVVLIAGGAGLLLCVGLGAFMLLRSSKKKVELAARQAQLPKPQGHKEAESDGGVAKLEGQPELKPLPEAPSRIEVLRKNLRENVNRDPLVAANVIRGWLQEDEA